MNASPVPRRLTMAIFLGYADSVAPHCAAGSCSLEFRAHQALTQASFFTPAVYGGCHGGAYERAVSRSRPARPVTSATHFRLAAVGGGSQLSEDHTMSKKSRRWYVPEDAPRTPDDLRFTSRDPQGRLNWWDVTPPNTDYWHAHQMLGRAYAFDLLDLLHNKRAEPIPPHAFGYIACAIARRGFAMPDGLYSGFFAAISEYLVTGEVDR